MDLKVFGATLVRRFDLSIIALLLAVGVGLSLSHLSGPRFTAVSSVVLIPPQSTVDSAKATSAYAPPNPLLYLGGLTQSRDILLRTLAAQQVGDDIKAKFPAVTYSVAGDTTSAGPLLIVTTTSGNEQQALAAMAAIDERIPRSLQTIQEDLKITTDNRITSLVLAADNAPAVDHKTQLQTSVFGAGAVALIGLLLVALVDNLLTSRRGLPRGGPRWWTRRSVGVAGGVRDTVAPSSGGQPTHAPGVPEPTAPETPEAGARPSPDVAPAIENEQAPVHRIPEVAAGPMSLADDVSADLRRRVHDLDYGSRPTSTIPAPAPRQTTPTGRR